MGGWKNTCGKVFFNTMYHKINGTELKQHAKYFWDLLENISVCHQQHCLKSSK